MNDATEDFLCGNVTLHPNGLSRNVSTTAINGGFFMRVWFNHWFSTAYHLINLIRDANPEFKFVGSNKNDYAIYKLPATNGTVSPKKFPTPIMSIGA